MQNLRPGAGPGEFGKGGCTNNWGVGICLKISQTKTDSYVELEKVCVQPTSNMALLSHNFMNRG